MRALIIGGNGAIGSAIARHADGQGIETHVGVRASPTVDRLTQHPAIRRHALDATDAASVGRVIRSVRPDWLVMTALPRSGHAPTQDARRALLLGMCEGLLGVLDGARNAEFAGRLVWIGSAMSYGEGGQPRRTDAVLRPQTFRGAVKAAESLLAAQLAAESGIAMTEVRVFTGYGPYEQRERFVASVLRAALSGDRVRLAQVPGRRDWIHYDDIARACLAAMASPTMPAVFNACSGRLHDTREVATLLETIVGKSLVADEIYPAGDCYGEVEPGQLPAPAEVDWAPAISLLQGLEHCWAWARSASGRAYLLAEPAA